MNTESDRDIIVTREEGVATLTLNRPDKLNAVTTAMWNQLPQVLDDLRKDDSVKVLLITGAGRGFCAGSDMGRLASVLEKQQGIKSSEIIRPTGHELLPLANLEKANINIVNGVEAGAGQFIDLLANLEKPTIAAINGVAAGAGLSIALACDIRIASQEARFTCVWVRVGFIPDAGATYYLPRIVGMSKALELMFTGDTIDAGEAERIGLVNRVVPHKELMAVTKELATRIAKGPSIAIKLMKLATLKGLRHDLMSYLDFESYALNICRQTDDHREGVEAFKQKREPQFKGR